MKPLYKAGHAGQRTVVEEDAITIFCAEIVNLCYNAELHDEMVGIVPKRGRQFSAPRKHSKQGVEIVVGKGRVLPVLGGKGKARLEQQTQAIALSSIRVGEAVYPFVEPRRAVFQRQARELLGTLTIDGLPQEFVGRGLRLKSALRNLSHRVHVAFQRIFTKQDYERTSDENQMWNELSKVIDIEQYNASLPIAMQRMGHISAIEDAHYTIRWHDGTEESIGLEATPAAFASLNVGDAFDAVAVYHSATGELSRVQDLSVRAALPEMPVKQAQKMYNGFKKQAQPEAVPWSDI